MSGARPASAARASISITSDLWLGAGAQLGRHEGSGGDRDDVFTRLLIGAPAREHDLARDLHAFAEYKDVLAGRCRLHVIDPEIERGVARGGALGGIADDHAQRRAYRHAAGVVQKAGDDPAMHDAGVRITDNLPRVG